MRRSAGPCFAHQSSVDVVLESCIHQAPTCPPPRARLAPSGRSPPFVLGPTFSQFRKIWSALQLVKNSGRKYSLVVRSSCSSASPPLPPPFVVVFAAVVVVNVASCLSALPFRSRISRAHAALRCVRGRTTSSCSRSTSGTSRRSMQRGRSRSPRGATSSPLPSARRRSSPTRRPSVREGMRRRRRLLCVAP